MTGNSENRIMPSWDRFPGETASIRSMTRADAERAARIDRDAFPDNVIHRYFRLDVSVRKFRWLASQGEAIALVAAVGPHVAGYAYGYPRGVKSRMYPCLLRGIAKDACGMLLRGDALRLLRRLITTQKRGRKAKDSFADKLPPPFIELVSIAVARDFQEQGLGAALLYSFEAKSAERGYRSAYLKARVDNGAAQGLYARRQWTTLLRTEESIYFFKELQDDSGRTRYEGVPR